MGTVKVTTEFLEGLGRLEVQVKAEVGNLRDEFRIFRTEMAALLEQANARAERMADRIIELAMVKEGFAREAVGHARQRGADSIPPQLSNSNSNLWGEPVPEEGEQWPPPGYSEFKVP